MLPKITDLDFSKALELAKQKLGFDHVPTGIALKRDLGLIDYKYVWFQKVINHGANIFIISYNSRFPTLYLSRNELKNTKTTRLYRTSPKGNGFDFDDYRLTPGIYIEEYLSRLPSNSMLIIRDLTGERFITEKYMYKNNKLEEVV